MATVGTATGSCSLSTPNLMLMHLDARLHNCVAGISYWQAAASLQYLVFFTTPSRAHPTALTWSTSSAPLPASRGILSLFNHRNAFVSVPGLFPRRSLSMPSLAVRRPCSPRLRATKSSCRLSVGVSSQPSTWPGGPVTENFIPLFSFSFSFSTPPPRPLGPMHTTHNNYYTRSAYFVALLSSPPAPSSLNVLACRIQYIIPLTRSHTHIHA